MVLYVLVCRWRPSALDGTAFNQSPEPWISSDLNLASSRSPFWCRTTSSTWEEFARVQWVYWSSALVFRTWRAVKIFQLDVNKGVPIVPIVQVVIGNTTTYIMGVWPQHSQAVQVQSSSSSPNGESGCSGAAWLIVALWIGLRGVFPNQKCKERWLQCSGECGSLVWAVQNIFYFCLFVAGSFLGNTVVCMPTEVFFLEFTQFTLSYEIMKFFRPPMVFYESLDISRPLFLKKILA